jgi:transcriptional regulator with XRE-family HTH domain
MPEYDPTRSAQVLDELRQGRNESQRETTLNADLDHGALRRYICDGRRPQRQALIALADHFGVDPNELLLLAGYPPMKLFQRVLVYPDSLPSDIGALVKDLQRIPDRTQRRKLAEAVRVLIPATWQTSRIEHAFPHLSL